jgi:hypothetical protein
MTTQHFPGIGEIGDIGLGGGKPPVKATPKKSDLELANERAETAERREREANEALQQSVAQRTAPPAPRAVEPTPPLPGKMPDPATQPGEFEEWQTRTREYDRWDNRQHVESVRSTESAAARSDKVIEACIAANPNYAPLRSHVFQCYHTAAKELNLTEIPEDTRALDALAGKKMRAMVNAAAAAADLPSGDPNTEGDPAQRTGGLSAGSTGGIGGGSPPSEEDGVEIKSLFDVQRDLQRKSGLF